MEILYCFISYFLALLSPCTHILQIGHLEHRALVERVNQDFERVRKVDTPFTIEFPAQMSVIKGGGSVLFGEEGPIVFPIHNISVLQMGREADKLPRVLGVSFHILNETTGGKNMQPLAPGDIMIRTVDGQEFTDFATGFQSRINLINKKESQYFACTVQFTNPDMKPYTRIKVEAHLHLGHVRDLSTPRCVQIRPFEIQLGEGYQRLDGADVLLIVNNQTQYDEVEAWRRQLGKIGSRFAVWNVHVYEDLALNHIRYDGRSLLEDFRCGTIVFLNNLCVRDEKLDHRCVEFARARELFLAARDHGIRVLMYGALDGFNIVNELIPALNHESLQLVHFENSSHYFKTIRKRIVPGLGGPLPRPATANGNVCGCLKIEKKKYWVTLDSPTKTLCYYKSGVQPYPNGVIYLQTFKLQQQGNGFLISTPVDAVYFMLPNDLELKRKRGRTYHNRPNYTESIEPWMNALIALISNAPPPPPSSFPPPSSLPSPTVPIASPPSSPSAPPSSVPNQSHIEPEQQGEEDVSEPLLSSPPSNHSQTTPLPSEPSVNNNNINALSTSPPLPLAGIAPTQGYLHLKSSFGGYKKYFFTLSPPMATLFYTTSPKSTQTKGAVQLGRYYVDPHGRRKDSAKFRVCTPTRTLKLKASSAESRDRWIAALGAVSPVAPLVLPYADPHARELRARHAGHLYKGFTRSDIAEPMTHTPVGRIVIEKRYFFGKPKLNDLASEARKLAVKLNDNFPNQRSLVVYNFGPTPYFRGFRKVSIGTLDIHRSLDQTSPHFVAFTSPPNTNIHNPDTIGHAATTYTLIKVQPLVRKLSIFNYEASQKAPSDKRDCYLANRMAMMELAMSAIVSDLAGELAHFAKANWRNGLPEKALRTRLSALLEIAQFPFDCLNRFEGWTQKVESVPGDALIEIFTHLEILMKSYLTIWDTLLPFRRRTYLAAATRTLARDALLAVFCAGPATSADSRAKISDAIEVRMRVKTQAWTELGVRNAWYGYSKRGQDIKVDKKVQQIAYAFPPGLATGTCDTHVDVPTWMSYQQFCSHYAASRPDRVIEGKFVVNSNSDRVLSVEHFQRESKCPDGREAELRTVVTPNVHPF